ncbi:MFS transporter [Schaalia canis]|uniref:MFS transporter n=1 Tax=Schaalia canis TaxID=100469 RepID=A0A3P1SFW0_9ACTO|nr:MFS transporter [Schaalia canis]RRC95886.1 MFS transporter [Schaalia canis]
MSRTFQSFAIGNYRLLFAGILFAAVGMWMQILAQDWLVLTELTDHDATQVGIVTALQFLPQLILSPWAGLLADRVDRRRLLYVTQLASAASALVLGLLVISGIVQLWHVYLLALVVGTVSSLDGPARMTFVSEVVPKTHLANAVGLNATAFHSARLVGPAVAGFVIDWAGTGWVFIINAALYIVPPATLALMKASEFQPRTVTPKAKGQIREGIAYVRSRPEIIMVFLAVAVVAGLGLNLQMTSAFMATEVYNKQASEYGILGSFIAIGGVLGSLIAARRRAPRLRTVVLAAAGFGIAETALALAPTFEAFMLLAIPTGFMSLTMMTSANALVQLTADEHIRGRVMSLYGMIFLGTSPICSPFVGWVAEALGARWSILVGSLSSIAVAIVVGIWAYLWRKSQGITPTLFELPRRRAS